MVGNTAGIRFRRALRTRDSVKIMRCLCQRTEEWCVLLLREWNNCPLPPFEDKNGFGRSRIDADNRRELDRILRILAKMAKEVGLGPLFLYWFMRQRAEPLSSNPPLSYSDSSMEVMTEDNVHHIQPHRYELEDFNGHGRTAPFPFRVDLGICECLLPFRIAGLRIFTEQDAENWRADRAQYRYHEDAHSIGNHEDYRVFVLEHKFRSGDQQRYPSVFKRIPEENFFVFYEFCSLVLSNAFFCVLLHFCFVRAPILNCFCFVDFAVNFVPFIGAYRGRRQNVGSRQ